MQNHPLANKTFLLMITDTAGDDIKQSTMSIQKGILKADGKYDVNCVAASTDGADKGTRSGTYKIEDSTDSKTVIHFTEQTGPFTGEYDVTINWLDKNIGTWTGNKDGNGEAVIGIVKTLD